MTSLFRLSISFQFSLGSLYVFRHLFIPSKLFSLLAYNCLHYHLVIFVFLWYQLFFLCHFLFCLFGSSFPDEIFGLSLVYLFKKNWLLVSLTFSIVFFVCFFFIYFGLYLLFITFFLLVTLGFVLLFLIIDNMLGCFLRFFFVFEVGLYCYKLSS